MQTMRRLLLPIGAVGLLACVATGCAGNSAPAADAQLREALAVLTLPERAATTAPAAERALRLIVARGRVGSCPLDDDALDSVSEFLGAAGPGSVESSLVMDFAVLGDRCAQDWGVRARLARVLSGEEAPVGPWACDRVSALQHGAPADARDDALGLVIDTAGACRLSDAELADALARWAVDPSFRTAAPPSGAADPWARLLGDAGQLVADRVDSDERFGVMMLRMLALPYLKGEEDPMEGGPRKLMAHAVSDELPALVTSLAAAFVRVAYERGAYSEMFAPLLDMSEYAGVMPSVRQALDSRARGGGEGIGLLLLVDLLHRERFAVAGALTPASLARTLYDLDARGLAKAQEAYDACAMDVHPVGQEAKEASAHLEALGDTLAAAACRLALAASPFAGGAPSLLDLFGGGAPAIPDPEQIRAASLAALAVADTAIASRWPSTALDALTTALSGASDPESAEGFQARCRSLDVLASKSERSRPVAMAARALALFVARDALSAESCAKVDLDLDALAGLDEAMRPLIETYGALALATCVSKTHPGRVRLALERARRARDSLEGAPPLLLVAAGETIAELAMEAGIPDLCATEQAALAELYLEAGLRDQAGAALVQAMLASFLGGDFAAAEAAAARADQLGLVRGEVAAKLAIFDVVRAATAEPGEARLAATRVEEMSEPPPCARAAVRSLLATRFGEREEARLALAELGAGDEGCADLRSVVGMAVLGRRPELADLVAPWLAEETEFRRGFGALNPPTAAWIEALLLGSEASVAQIGALAKSARASATDLLLAALDAAGSARSFQMQAFAFAAMAEMLLARGGADATREALRCDSFRLGQQQSLREARVLLAESVPEHARDGLRAIAARLGQLDEELAVPPAFRARDLDALIQARDELRAEAAGLVGVQRSGTRAPAEVEIDLDGLCGRLGADVRVVVLAVHADGTTAYVLSSEGVRAVSTAVSALDLGGHVQAFRDAVGSAASVTDPALQRIMETSGRALSAALVTPLEERSLLAPGQRLIWVLDEALWGLPISMLPRGGGRALVDDYEVALAPSLRLRRGPSAGGAPGRALLVGAIDYDAERYELTAQGRRDRLPSLPGSPRELAVTEKLLKASGSDVTVLRRERATPARVVEALGQGELDLALLSVHGAGGPSETAPLGRSELYVSAGEGGDGRLSRSSLASLPRAPRTVVLSACDTATGETLPGEGMLGMAQAFLLAGAGTVVAATHPVNDATATLTMELFHRDLAAGSDPVAALAHARRELGRSTIELTGGERGLVSRVRPADAPARGLRVPGHHPYLRGAFEVIVGELPER